MSEIVRYTPRGGVPIRIEGTISLGLVAPIVGAVSAVVQEVLLQGIQVGTAVVSACGNARLELEYYDAQRQLFRRDVLDTLALAAVAQGSRDRLRSMGLDADIHAKASARIDRKLWG